MTQHIPLELFTSELFAIIQETFEQVDGMYLDKGTSLFETLQTISAEEASRPVSATCASIAGQVNHVRFYLDILQEYMQQTRTEQADWDASWRVSTVTKTQWDTLQQELRQSYDRFLALIKSFDTWSGEEDISGALAIVVHTAYHLGEIRQALCTVRQS